MEAQPPFKNVSSESSSEDVPLDYYSYMTPVLEHNDGEVIFLKPGSILRMQVESAEVPWTEFRFKKNS